MSDNSTGIAAVTSAALDTLTSDTLLAFLVKQRWYAIKGATDANARVIDSVGLPWGDGRYAIARLGVRAGGVEHVYQLPIARLDVPDAGIPDRAVLCTSEMDNATVTLIDAVHDAEFRRGLVQAISTGARAERDGVAWVAESVGDTPLTVTDQTSTTVGSAEQSNTSIIVGDIAILKLFRLLKPGVQPDVEVTRFLTTRAGFPNTPALLGSMRLHTTDAPDTTLGMMQRFLPASSDAWSYALNRGRAYFAAPQGRDVPNTFFDDAERIGAITRAMHEALACDDDDAAFAPEPATHEDIDRWAQRTKQSVRESLALLKQRITSPDFPRERVPEAQALVGRGDHYAGWVDEIDDVLGDDLGMCIRVHGDYHLGQVLRTKSNEFMVIDFEGEPSRTLDERREKTSPLRDVAGMLRSFAYAAATLAMSANAELDAPTRELRAARWERDVRTAFLEGYLGAIEERDDHPDVLPEEELHVRQLIALFEMEKAFYELTYELNNRPAWAWIPMRGIAKLAMR